jgi:hypothetical protein
MSPLTILLLAVGATLIYAGMKDVNPRDVIRDSLKGKDQPGLNPQASSMSPPEDMGRARV